MADGTPTRPLSIKERAELLRQEAARKEEIGKLVKGVYDDLLSTFSGYLDAYNNDPFTKQAVEANAKPPVTPEGIFNVMANDTLKDVLAKINEMPDTGGDPKLGDKQVALAIYAALTQKSGIKPDTMKGDVVAVSDYLASDTTYSMAAMLEAFKGVAKDKNLLKGKKPAKPAKPTDTDMPTTEVPVAPVVPSDEWTKSLAPDTDVPTSIPPLQINQGSDPIFPDLTGMNSPKKPETAAEIEAAVKKLEKDAKRIKLVCETALNPTVAGNYSNLDSKGNVRFLQRLALAATETLDTINTLKPAPQMVKGAPVPSGKPEIKVIESQKPLWQTALTKGTARINAALVDFEGADFALSKQKSPLQKNRAKERIAGEMLETITVKCKVPTTTQHDGSLDPLDDALTGPGVFQKHGKKIGIGLLGTLTLLAGGIVGPKLMNSSNDKKPDNGVQVAQNDTPPDNAKKKPDVKPAPVKPAEPKSEEGKKPEEPKKEEPKKEEPKKDAPKMEAPKPEEVGPPKPVDPPKVDAPKVAKPEDNPVGKKTNELKVLFEKNVINDFVLANPDVVKRGFIIDKEGVFKVSDNVKVSYLPLEDVTKGIWVFHNNQTGRTLIAPPANKRLDIGIVANSSTQKKLSTSFHISEIKGGKETVLKDQLGEAISFSLPNHVTPDKFMTGQQVFDLNNAAIELGAHYLGGKDELRDTQRVDGVESPIVHLGINISGIPIIVHSGVAVDTRSAKLDFLTRTSSRSVRTETAAGGSGDPSDGYILLAKNKQEPLIITDKYTLNYDIGRDKIVPGKNGGWDTPDLKFTGIALPMAHRGFLPFGDKRDPKYRDIVTSHEGGGTLYILPNKDVTFRTARNNENPLSYTEGAPLSNKQVLRIKAFIEDTKNTLYPADGKLFTFGEFATESIRAQYELSQIKWSRLESPRAHSMAMPQLEPGAFGPAAGPQMARPGLREGNTAVRYNTDALTLKDENENKQHTWLDEHKRAAQALYDRATDPTELGRTKKAAADKFKAAETLIKEINKLKDDDADKPKKLNELYDLEAEAARLLAVPFPDPLREGADDKEKQAHGKAMAAARTLIRNLIQKAPAAILQNRIEAELQKQMDPKLPLFKTSGDDEGMDGAMIMPKGDTRYALDDTLRELEERKGLPGRGNAITKFVEEKRGLDRFLKDAEESDKIASHRDRSTGKNDKPWERG